MNIVAILAVLVFTTSLCIVEIPKMVKENLYRELVAFSILLGFGTILAILKSLNVEIPNPSDFIAWVYSPVTEIMRSFFK
jgi:hypothetical protein